MGYKQLFYWEAAFKVLKLHLESKPLFDKWVAKTIGKYFYIWQQQKKTNKYYEC